MNKQISKVSEREALRLCLSYLADLNGCDWIKGTDPASLDMKQRALALQQTAFRTLEPRA